MHISDYYFLHRWNHIQIKKTYFLSDSYNWSRRIREANNKKMSLIILFQNLQEDLRTAKYIILGGGRNIGKRETVITEYSQ